MEVDNLSLDEELLQVAGRGNKRRWEEEEDEEVSGAESDSADEGPSNKQKSKKSSKKRASNKDSSDEEFDDGYGADLMGDAEDRAKLLAMNELSREMILAERAEKRDEARERMKNARLVKQKHRTEELADPTRASTRTKGNQQRKDAMLELVAAKQAREQRGRHKSRSRRRQERGSGGDWSEDESLSVSGDESDEEGSKEEEEDFRRGGGRQRGASDRDESPGGRREAADRDHDEHIRKAHEGVEVAPFDEVKKVTVRRFLLEKWVGEPFFKDTITGCVVRVSIGMKRDPKHPLDPPAPEYMLARIVEFIDRDPGQYRDPTGKSWTTPYAFGGGALKTGVWMRLTRGDRDALWPMCLVSNSGITEEEFENWQKATRKAERPLLMQREVDEAKKRLVAAEKYVYSAEDVQRMVEAKRQKGGIVRNVAAEKARLLSLLQHAQESDDKEEEERVTQMLAALETHMAGAIQASKRSSTKNLNARNANANFQNAFANVSARFDKNLKQDQGFDPYSRRATGTLLYWKTNRQQEAEAQARVEAGEEPHEGDAELLAGAAGASAAADAAAAAAGAGAGGPAAAAAPASASVTVVEGGDLELNINLNVLGAPPKSRSHSRRLLGPHWQLAAATSAPPNLSNMQILTLSDYQRKLGVL